jgi:hypothetical protein
MKVIIHVGLDVHNDSITISLAPSDSTEVRRWGLIGGTHEHVQRLVKQLQGGASRGAMSRRLCASGDTAARHPYPAMPARQRR